MGNSDVVYLLFPFVLSVFLVLAIILCCLKCKLLVERPHGKIRSPMDEQSFGNLINIQEYAENQIGTTIVYAESPNSCAPHPYMYYTDGYSATIVPIQSSSHLGSIYSASSASVRNTPRNLRPCTVSTTMTTINDDTISTAPSSPTVLRTMDSVLVPMTLAVPVQPQVHLTLQSLVSPIIPLPVSPPSPETDNLQMQLQDVSVLQRPQSTNIVSPEKLSVAKKPDDLPPSYEDCMKIATESGVVDVVN